MPEDLQRLKNIGRFIKKQFKNKKNPNYNDNDFIKLAGHQLKDTSLVQPQNHDTIAKYEAPTGDVNVSVDGWYITISDSVADLVERIDHIKEWFYPIASQDLVPIDEYDRSILEQQEKTKDLTRVFKRSQRQRNLVLKRKHLKDVTRAQQKKNICANWYNEEVAHLDYTQEKNKGVVPPLGSEYSEYPGWIVQESDSDYRGHNPLCQALDCSSSGLAPLSESRHSNAECTQFNQKFIDVLNENQQFRYDKMRIQNDLITCQQGLITSTNDPNMYGQSVGAVSGYQQSNPQSNQYGNPELNQQSNQYGNPQSNPELNQYGNPQLEPAAPSLKGILEWIGRFGRKPKVYLTPTQILLGSGSIFDKIIHVLIFPLRVIDKDAPVWHGTPPEILFRMVVSFGLLTIWYKISCTLYQIVSYMLEFLPKPPTQRLKPNEPERLEELELPEKEKELKTNRSRGIINTVNKICRGGAALETLSSLSYSERENILQSIDPVFFLIRLEKIKQEIMASNSRKLANRNLIQKLKKKRSFQKGFQRFHKRLKNTIKLSTSPFVPYVFFAMMTLGSISTPLSLRTSNQQIERVINEDQVKLNDSNESFNDMMIGDKKITMNSSSKKSEKINERQDKLETNQIKNNADEIKTKSQQPMKTGVRNQAKIRKLSDLPPLSSLDFEEILTEVSQKASNRIRIQ